MKKGIFLNGKVLGGLFFVFFFISLFVCPVLANSLEDYLSNAYCSVEGTKVVIGNIVIGNNSYLAEWQLNPENVAFELSDYSIQNDNPLYVSVKDLYSKAYNVEPLDSDSPELSDFNTEGCQEIWKYYYPLCHAYKFLCFTSKNYRLLGALYDYGNKLITLEARGLPIYLANNSIFVEQVRFKKIVNNSQEIFFEATVAITAKHVNDKWFVDFIFSGPPNGFGSLTKYEYDPTNDIVRVYKAVNRFQEVVVQE